MRPPVLCSHLPAPLTQSMLEGKSWVHAASPPVCAHDPGQACVTAHVWALHTAQLTGLCWRRVFCQLLRPDLERVLAQQPPTKGPLLDLFHAVHQVESRAQKLIPSTLGTPCAPSSSLMPTFASLGTQSGLARSASSLLPGMSRRARAQSLMRCRPSSAWGAALYFC